MNPNYANEIEEADAMLNESLSEADPEGIPTMGDDELRRARIAEYRHEALRKEDSLRANLGAINAGLLEIALEHEIAVRKALQSGAGNMLESPYFQRAISTHLNITRQVDRFANVDVRFEAAEQQAENAKAQRRLPAMPTATRAQYRRDRA